MNAFFLTVRILAGLASLAGLLLVGLIWLVRDSLRLAQEGVGVLGYVIALFTSGFTQGTRPPEPAGWEASLPQAVLAVLFLAMLVTVFFPQRLPVLHAVALAVAAAVVGLFYFVFTTPRLEVLCLPFLWVWGGYYLLAVWRK